MRGEERFGHIYPRKEIPRVIIIIIYRPGARGIQ